MYVRTQLPVNNQNEALKEYRYSNLNPSSSEAACCYSSLLVSLFFFSALLSRIDIPKEFAREKRQIMKNSNKQPQRMKDLSLNTYTLSAPHSGY
jgi:hypothetical protein